MGQPPPSRTPRRLLRAADVCIVSVAAPRSFGLVALEAAACGTPVVAAAVGGLRSLIDHGQSGFLVEGRDPADYAAPVGQLLSGRDARERYGDQCVGGMNSPRYSWSMTAARLRVCRTGDLVARGLVRCD